jgi:hypothetical protein
MSDKWELEENKKGHFYWWQTSHHYHSKKGEKCKCCGKIRHFLHRINYPKITNQKETSCPITKGFPLRNPFNDWSCTFCWSHCGAFEHAKRVKKG